MLSSRIARCFTSVHLRPSCRGIVTSATFDVTPFKLHKLDKGPPDTGIELTRDDALDFYRNMQRIRRLEGASSTLYKSKIIRGFCHLYSGQEACCVGIRAAMKEDDGIITAYRAHGWALMMGETPESVLSELTGKYSGCSQGKGGSMHMYAQNFYGGNGIVGAQTPLGAGVAFSYKYRQTDNVCFTLYGDGAANQGQLFEAFNMSSLWGLPVVFVCENNGYGMGTSADRAAANTNYYMRGDYIPGIWVDGMDVLAMREAARFATEWGGSGKGPLVIEAATYRYHGHSMSDPGSSYRSREEIQEVRETRDPITGLRKRLLESELATEAEIKAIDKEARREVDAAMELAKTAPEPPLTEAYTQIFWNTPEFRVRGCDPFTFGVSPTCN